MADTIVAKNTDAKFTPHPEGQFVAQCVDAIDLGERVKDYTGRPKYLAHECALVFRTGEVNEEGKPIDVARELTVSMGEKANLRKLLESWRGKQYTAEEADAGVPVDKLVGQHALLTIEHKVSGKGRTYANIVAAVGVPKQMRDKVPDYTQDYERDPYWTKKKEEYAKMAAAFRGDTNGKRPKQAEDFGDLDDADGDDDLPF